MKKREITKIALMGLATGCFLAAQAPNQAQAQENQATQENFARHLAAGSCGGKGGCGGETNDKKNGSMRKNNNGNNNHMNKNSGNSCNGKNGCGGDKGSCGGDKGKNGSMKDNDMQDGQGYYIPPERRKTMDRTANKRMDRNNDPHNTNPNPNEPMQPMSEKKLLSQCNDECRQRYQAMDQQGKQLALRLAATTDNANQAIRDAQADMRNRMENSSYGGRIKNGMQDKDWDKMREDVRREAQERTNKARMKGLNQQ